MFEKEYEKLLDMIGSLVVVLDRDGRVDFLNRKGYEVLGYKKGDLTGKDWISTCIPKDNRERIRSVFSKCLKGKAKLVEHHENTVITKEKKIRMIKWFNSLVKNKNGEITGIIASGDDVTRQREWEKTLKESEKKYRFVVDNTNELIVITNKIGKILFANKTLVKNFGYKEEDVIGKSIVGFLTRDSFKRAIYMIAQEFMGKKQEEADLELKTKSGEVRTVRFATSSAPVYENGKMIGILSTARDVTDIIKAEKALKESEEMFRTIFENANDVIILLDKTGKVLEVNSRIYDILGYKPKDVMGKNFTMTGILPVSDTPKILKTFVSSMKKNDDEENKIDTIQLRLKHKKGRDVFVDIWVSFIKNEGKTESILTTMRDITERVDWERKLKESEEKYRKQFEESLDAIFVADAKTGIITDCNMAAKTLTGRKKSELIGKHQKILHPPSKMNGRFTSEFKEHLKGKKENIIETRIIRKDGMLRDVSIKANIIDVGGKKFLHGVFRDVTEKRKVEEEIRKSEKRFHTLFKRMPDAAIVLDRKGTFLEASEEAEKISGYDVSEVLGKNLFKMPILDMKNRAIVAGKMSLMFAKDKISDFDIEINSKNGKIIPIEISGCTIDYMGRKAVIVIMRDMTEHIRRNNEMRESEERFRTIFESSNDAIFIHDTKTGDILDVNQKTCELFGYSKEKMKKMNVGDISSNEGQYTRKNAVKKIKSISTEGPVVFEWVSKDSRGRVFDTEVNLKIVMLSGKRRILAIVRDIESRKKWEKQLMQSKNQLEDKVEELEKFNKISIGRELQMVRLKQRIKELEKK